MERVDGALEDFSSSGLAALRLKSANHCILTFCEREYSVTTLDGIAGVLLLNTNYGLFTRPSDLTYLDKAGKKITRMLTCWQPDEGDANFTSPDGNLTFLDRDKRASCPTNDYGYEIGGLISEIVSLQVPNSWFFGPSHIGYNKRQSTP